MADDDIELFRRAMADAKPLKAENRAASTVREPLAKPRPKQRQKNAAPVARAFAAATIDDNDGDYDDNRDDDLSMRFQRPSVGRRVMRKLARGGYRVDDAMDLPVREFADAFEMNYPVLLGDIHAVSLSRRLGNRYEGLPFTVVAAPGGNVVLRRAGSLKRDELEPILRDLTSAG